MTVELLSNLTGIAVSLVFSYVPWVSEWYYNLDKKWRGLLMAGVMLVLTAVYFVFGCYNMFGVSLSCNSVTAQQLISTYLSALIVNQGTYLVTPKSPFKK